MKLHDAARLLLLKVCAKSAMRHRRVLLTVLYAVSSAELSTLAIPMPPIRPLANGTRAASIAPARGLEQNDVV